MALPWEELPPPAHGCRPREEEGGGAAGGQTPEVGGGSPAVRNTLCSVNSAGGAAHWLGTLRCWWRWVDVEGCSLNHSNSEFSGLANSLAWCALQRQHRQSGPCCVVVRVFQIVIFYTCILLLKVDFNHLNTRFISLTAMTSCLILNDRLVVLSCKQLSKIKRQFSQNWLEHPALSEL